jgi:hypothetical protein
MSCPCGFGYSKIRESEYRTSYILVLREGILQSYAYGIWRSQTPMDILRRTPACPTALAGGLPLPIRNRDKL